MVLLDCPIPSAVPFHVRGALIVALRIEPPAPMRMPPSVVDPVPPKFTESVDVPTVLPVAFVNKSEFCMLEMVRFVVDAVFAYTVPFAERLVVLAPLKNDANPETLRAPEKYPAPPTESIEPGEVVPIPKN